MQSSHDFPEHHSDSWKPTIGLAWVHFAIALGFGVLALTRDVYPLLAVAGMAVFGVIAMIFALLTITR